MNASMLEKQPIFTCLSASQRAAIAERMVKESRRAGERIFTAGASASHLYVIESGIVRLRSETGRVLGTQDTGDTIGEADVLLGQPYATTAEAATDVVLWALPGGELSPVVAADPEAGLCLSRFFGATVAPLIDYLVERRLRLSQGMDSLPRAALAALAGRLAFATSPPVRSSREPARHTCSSQVR